MMKSKLIRLGIGKTINELAEIFIGHQFKSGSHSGIDLLRFNSSQLHAKFIEELVINEKQVDPFGNQIENKIIRFCVFEFFINELKPHQFLIKIDAPPRSLKSFTALLQNSLGFGVSISNVNLDILSLIKGLKDLPSYKDWQLKKARISGIRLSSTSVSKMDIESKADAYQDAQEVLDLQNTLVERVTYQIKSTGSTVSLEITNSGQLIGDENAIDDLISFISIDID